MKFSPKCNPIVSSLIAFAAIATPTVMFGAAADLNACCTPGDKDMPKSGINLGNQSYSSLNQVNQVEHQPARPGLEDRTSASRRRRSRSPGPGTTDTGQQTTPIIVDGVIYLDTENGGVIAVDGATGASQVEVAADDGDRRALRDDRHAPWRVGR